MSIKTEMVVTGKLITIKNVENIKLCSTSKDTDCKINVKY